MTMNEDDNDGRVRLRIMGLSYNQLQSGAYALVLAQVDGPVKIPIIIGAPDAQSIAVRMENITPQRPMTHDLFVSFAHAFGVTLKEVFIYKFEDGIFSSELTFTDGSREVKLDARTSDAVAIALRTKSPIYTTREILEETGFVLDESPSAAPSDSVADEEPERGPRLENYAIEELQRTLEKHIADENYEEAARVTEILRRKREALDRKDEGDSPEGASSSEKE